MADDLSRVMTELDERARLDPRLDRYRVRGRGREALVDVPPGWRVSDAIARIATDGGWWPGEWLFPRSDDIVATVLSVSTTPPAHAQIIWLGVGTVWERDHFWTPAMQVSAPSAPLFGFSNQALWASMVFPTEAAILEAFAVTYDELGMDEHGAVNPFFVEWVTTSPPSSEPAAAQRVHERIAALAKTWTTSHPVWVPSAMPRLDDGIWPDELVAALLGVPPTST